MIELVMLIPLFIVGLVVFWAIDSKQPHKSKTPTLETLTLKAQNEVIKEMQNKLIEYYGNKTLDEKNLNSYEELAEEIARIDRKNNHAK